MFWGQRAAILQCKPLSRNVRTFKLLGFPSAKSKPGYRFWAHMIWAWAQIIATLQVKRFQFCETQNLTRLYPQNTLLSESLTHTLAQLFCLYNGLTVTLPPLLVDNTICSSPPKMYIRINFGPFWIDSDQKLCLYHFFDLWPHFSKKMAMYLCPHFGLVSHFFAFGDCCLIFTYIRLK